MSIFHFTLDFIFDYAIINDNKQPHGGLEMSIEEIINAIYLRNQNVPQDIRKDLHEALKINRKGIPGPAHINKTIVFYAFPNSNEEQEVKRQLWFKREKNSFEVTFKYFPGGGAAQRSIRLSVSKGKVHPHYNSKLR